MKRVTTRLLSFMKITNFLILATGLSLFCASCAKQESQSNKPVKQVSQKTESDTKPRKVSTQPSTQSKKTAPPKPAKKPDQAKPPKQDQQASQAEPSTSPASTTLFRTPADDIKLPTDAEIDEGKDAGKQPTADRPASSPSISVKPPASSTPPGKP